MSGLQIPPRAQGASSGVPVDAGSTPIPNVPMRGCPVLQEVGRRMSKAVSFLPAMHHEAPGTKSHREEGLWGGRPAGMKS